VIAPMNLDAIVQSIHAEIDRLQQARSSLTVQKRRFPRVKVSEESKNRMAAAQRERRKREGAQK
jgi:uncharacterized protein (DUF488 family)